jgi:hypothetical protein
MAAKKKKPKKPVAPRNPFAGQSRGGAGFHTEKKYGKKERREEEQEVEEGLEETTRTDTDQPDED